MKLLREVKTAVRVGGTNPEANSRLATAINAARINSVPKAKIEAAIFPENAGASDLLFEAMAPGGVGLLIRAEADNKIAASHNVRRVLTKMNCTLGNQGSVAWMFDPKGVIVADGSHADLARDPEEVAIEAGAENVEVDKDENTVTVRSWCGWCGVDCCCKILDANFVNNTLPRMFLVSVCAGGL